jgi:hypothetical protein
LSDEPLSFDGELAVEDLRTIAADFPRRTAGSDQDNLCVIWLVREIERIGLDVHIDSFPAVIGGRDVALQNVYGVSRGTSRGTIVLVANRDVAPTATQGANDNASGMAALLELARAFTVTAHRHTILFLFTDGDAVSDLGSRDFVARHENDDVLAVIGLRKVATASPSGLEADGWSLAPRTAPPWLWLLTAPAARTVADLDALLPATSEQLVRLAVPISADLQAPFVAAGLPALTVSAAGEDVPHSLDTTDVIAEQALAEFGSIVQSMVLAVDAAPPLKRDSDGTIFLTRGRTLPGGSLAFVLLAALLPLAAVTLDLYAQTRRAREALRPAWRRLGLALLPWVATLGVVYLANVLRLLPAGPGGVLSPDAELAATPRYVSAALLLAVFAVIALYAHRVERRLERRDGGPPGPHASLAVMMIALLAIALLTAVVNVYTLLVLLPAALAWPLARAGRDTRAWAPVVAGLVMVAVVAVALATETGLGVDVWWYVLVLVETRAASPLFVLLGLAFFATTWTFARTLRDPALATLQSRSSPDDGLDRRGRDGDPTPRRRPGGQGGDEPMPPAGGS